MPLTIKEIENAKPREKKYKLADGGGLCLVVQPWGGKFWLWRYRFDGTEKNMTFGDYPHVAPKDARDLHFAAKKLLAAGTNPMSERKAETEAKQQQAKDVQRVADTSLEKVARKWWAWWSIGKSPRHAETLMNRLEADVFPIIGHLPIDAVLTTHIRGIMLTIETRGASDVAKGHISPSDRFSALQSRGNLRVGTLRLTSGRATYWPQDGWLQRRRPHTLWAQLLAYCFPRTSELIEAPWTEFDLDRARWDIPKERMKMKTPHIVPLSRQAVEVLRALKLLTGNGKLVFPGALDKEKPMSNNTLLYALYRLGYQGRMTGHGFRGLASTILNENDFDDEHVDLQLAHMKRNKVSAAYNNAKCLKQRTIMMQWWADYLDAQAAKGRKKLAA
jgi:integrase